MNRLLCCILQATLCISSVWMVSGIEDTDNDILCHVPASLKMSTCSGAGSVLSTKDLMYVPEGTLCKTSSGECSKCLGGQLQQTHCNAPRKRGFFKKIFKKIASIPKKIFRKPKPVRVVNTPPEVICPAVPSTFTVPERQTEVKVTWAAPRVNDRQGNVRSTQIVKGRGPGSMFGAGVHTIVYKAVDTGNLSGFCTITFTVKVIKCPLLLDPNDGRVRCSHGQLYGSSCTFSCDDGYTITTEQNPIVCASNGRYDAEIPSCKKTECEVLELPTNGKQLSCTDENKYESRCGFSCLKGFLPANGAMAVCTDAKNWTKFQWVCEDKVTPEFVNCPTKKINTIEKRYIWEEITATDNSGNVTVKQVHGPDPGTNLTIGAHIIKYEATDAAGNKEFCHFIVELKQTDCPKPSSNDSDVQFTCNGMTGDSVCLLTCKSGAQIEGSRYISCLASETENNTSEWKPLYGAEAKCHRRTCPPLTPPKNGALVCDKQLGGTLCQLQCDDLFDVAIDNLKHYSFICGHQSQRWSPSDDVPDCTEMSFPDEYYLPTDLFYYTGDCTDQATLIQVKEQFLENMLTLGIIPCVRDPCTVDDVEVSCGDKGETDVDLLRKRRSVIKQKLVRIRLTLKLRNTNRTMSPLEAKEKLVSLLQKSTEMLSSDIKFRKLNVKHEIAKNPIPKSDLAKLKPYSGISKMSKSATKIGPNPSTKPVLPPVIPVLNVTSVAGNMTMVCPPGHIQMDAVSGICVPCPAGTYSDREYCQPCPRATFQNQSTSTSCHRCPENYTTPSTGSTSEWECTALCSKGHFSPTGHVPCYPCRPGTYQTAIGAKTCDSCPDVMTPISMLYCMIQIHTTVRGSSRTSPRMMISDFLLTCDNEVCLSF